MNEEQRAAEEKRARSMKHMIQEQKQQAAQQRQKQFIERQDRTR